ERIAQRHPKRFVSFGVRIVNDGYVQGLRRFPSRKAQRANHSGKVAPAKRLAVLRGTIDGECVRVRCLVINGRWTTGIARARHRNCGPAFTFADQIDWRVELQSRGSW